MALHIRRIKCGDRKIPCSRWEIADDIGRSSGIRNRDAVRQRCGVGPVVNAITSQIRQGRAIGIGGWRKPRQRRGARGNLGDRDRERRQRGAENSIADADTDI